MHFLCIPNVVKNTVFVSVKTPKKTTRNPDRTKARLLSVGIRLFAEHGYHGVSVDQIVNEAGVNKRMVYHYFGSKEDLYRAALLDVYRRIEGIEFAAVSEGRTPREKLERIMRAYYEFNAKNPEFVKLLLWENLNKGQAIRKQEHFLQKNPFLEKFTQIIEEGKSSGEFRKDLDVRHLLIDFIGLCFIYYSNRYTLSQSLNLDLDDERVLQSAIDHSLSLIFNGLLTNKAS